MADNVVHIGENSPERVAFVLMERVLGVEKKSFHTSPPTGHTTLTRKEILDAYAECLEAVRGRR
jgi:hypothetical protein